MAKGRKKIPDNILKLKGTHRKCRAVQPPAGDDDRDPVMIPGGFLSCRAKEIFTDLYQKIEAMNYSDNAHSNMLGLLAVTLEEVEILTAALKDQDLSYETTSTTGEKIHKARPEVKQRADAIRRAQSLLSEFGLSAASLGKVSRGQVKKKHDPFEKF